MSKYPIVHFEIPADNVERAKDFYQKTFDWKINKFDMPANSTTGGEPYYGVTTVESDENGMPIKPGGINGGLMKRMSEQQTLMNYIYVDEISDVLTKIKENGGQVCMPKTEIAPGMGYIACFKDTEGNMMGLHQLGENKK